ncbi:probable pyridoxal 5'-phosphate synthase subunit PDX2 isoform X1 [Selaginella moellendorffii]|uniref:probable pyridoxal 5'-phosphate synthase subunit PDX2 isoform X1 n=1 Tax=Selaginella moellendorffii TaxID=88036 RepID=UPI000D1C65DD|nr:probable pyridoxal 5'-phosphate synthase subunit PDX2 isoform X1 [Selaginella moellendorffii]|eukprot:XP_024525578.1 probable pyridoxal 5'-phosphate synthase subunit PDX2 isoform X1 [Selaginella moellendorffii]
MAIGVLALQGSFHEHVLALRRLGVHAIEVRKADQLEGLAGLIIPGGESTTMAKLANQYNLFPALKDFSTSGKPMWGTCAGLIFLADRATGTFVLRSLTIKAFCNFLSTGLKDGGQELLGGLDCTVHRNFFGSQVNSFETELAVPALAASEGGPPRCRAVFIRAPAIVEFGSSVEQIADCEVPSFSAPPSLEGEMFTRRRVAVAVRQGNFLGTAFHPELTSDTRWHSYFVKMVQAFEEVAASSALVPQKFCCRNDSFEEMKDLPIFEGLVQEKIL